MPKLRVFSGAELCNFLSEHGFERVRQRGSHVVMRRGEVSFPVPLHHQLESFVKADFPGRTSNDFSSALCSAITDHRSPITDLSLRTSVVCPLEFLLPT